MSLKNIILGVAILILTISVSVYGVNIFLDEPKYEDFCSSERFPKIVGERDLICPAVCVEMYEILNNECIINSCGSGCGPDGVNTFDKLNQCEIILSGKNCYDLYDNAQEEYSKKVFLIALPLGIIVIALGALVFGLESVGAGLMGGGVGIILYGVGAFWRFADDWLKFVLSLAGLILLIWFAYWFEKRKKNFWQRFFGKKR